MNLESPLYIYYVAMSLFCESFGFFVCKQWKETISSKVGICLKKEQDGQASERQETKAAPGLSSQNWQPFSFGCSLRWQASLTPNFLPLYSKSNSWERGAWLGQAWIRFPCWIKLLWPDGVTALICKVGERWGEKGLNWIAIPQLFV